MGLQEIDSGKIYVDQESVNYLDSENLKNIRLKCGLLFQSAALFDSMNVYENVAFPLVQNFKWDKWKIKERVNETLELVEMSGNGDKMPSELSGGQRKRIGLARAIATYPKIAFYDEPTTGLDPILSTNIENLIVKLNTQLKMTSIIVTHQISTIIRTADNIYLLQDGKLLTAEKPSTIFDSQNNFVRRFIRGGLNT